MASSDGLARRLRLPVLGVVLVYAYGVVGYLLFGFGWVDAVTQTALALTTVGFSIQVPLSDGAKLFTASPGAGGGQPVPDPAGRAGGRAGGGELSPGGEETTDAVADRTDA